MKRWSWVIVVLISLLLFAPQSLRAQEANLPLKATDQAKPELSIFPPKRSLTNPLGQSHRYTVTFRGNGEAVVALRVVLSNLEKKPLPTLSLRLPRVRAEDILAFQVNQEPLCVRWSEDVSPFRGEPSGISYQEARCLEQEPVNYYDGWFDATYTKASVELKNDTLTVTLPQPIKPDTSGGIVLIYRAFGYAQKNILGAWSYRFETLKVEDRIHELALGILTDPDLHLRGGKSWMEYRFDQGLSETAKTQAALPSFRSQNFDLWTSQIGQGAIQKYAANLQPLDSYTVTGLYADSQLRLYIKEVIIGIAVTLILGSAFFLILKRLLPAAGRDTTTTVATSQTVEVALVFLSSFLSATFAIVYTIGLWFIVRQLNESGIYGEAMFLIYALLLLFSLLVYGICLSFPAILMGLRRGIVWGLATAGATLFWLIISLVILLVIFLPRNPPRMIPQPLYKIMNEGGEPAQGVEEKSAVPSEEGETSPVSP